MHQSPPRLVCSFGGFAELIVWQELSGLRWLVSGSGLFTPVHSCVSIYIKQDRMKKQSRQGISILVAQKWL